MVRAPSLARFYGRCRDSALLSGQSGTNGQCTTCSLRRSFDTTPGVRRGQADPRYEQLLVRAERDLRALDRDLCISKGAEPEILEDRERTAEALQDLREFSVTVMALINAPVRR